MLFLKNLDRNYSRAIFFLGVISGGHDRACGRSYVFFFFLFDCRSQNVDALLLQGRLGNPCDAQQHQPQRSTKTPSGGVLDASVQQGVGVTSDIFPLLALLIMCFDVFLPAERQSVQPLAFVGDCKNFMFTSVLQFFCYSFSHLKLLFFPQILSFERFLF